MKQAVRRFGPGTKGTLMDGRVTPRRAGRTGRAIRPGMWTAVVLVLASVAPRHTVGQTVERTLDARGEWVVVDQPAEGSPEALYQQAAAALAEGRPDRAQSLATDFIERHPDHPRIADAYLLRGDARAARGNEYHALYDYEYLIRNFPESAAFTRALEREFDIALEYAAGRKRKLWGVRWVGAEAEAEEIFLLTHERAPGSRLAQKAGRALGDFFFARREMDFAAIAYASYLRNHPRAEDRAEVTQRLIYAYLGTVKGPQFDPSGLYDAREQIGRLEVRYPRAAEEMGSRALRARIDESDAERMFADAEWYLDRGDPVSAEFVLDRLRRRYPETATARRAWRIMVERGWIEPVDLDADRPANAVWDLGDEPPESPPAPAPSASDGAPPENRETGSGGPGMSDENPSADRSTTPPPSPPPAGEPVVRSEGSTLVIEDTASGSTAEEGR